jgi:hypothetical protein
LATAVRVLAVGKRGRGALLLVAHGDTLQILQALLQQSAEAPGGTALLAMHRRFAMTTGELRALC